MIIAYLDPERLRNFALASTVCNNLAERLLWRSFRIHSRERPDVQHIAARIDALLRLPHRARYVRKLTIGPCDWAWNATLLVLLPVLWKFVPCLQTLILERRPRTSLCSRHGDEFSPVIRILAHHGDHLRLQIFQFHGWMRPGSHLYQFLAGQTQLKELRGVDLFASRPVEFDNAFLPSLRTLVCEDPYTACSLLPERLISTLEVKKLLTYDQLDAITATIARQASSLTTVILELDFPDRHPYPSPCLGPLLAGIPSVKRLVITGYGGAEEDAFLLSGLPSLEDLDCAFYPVPWDSASKAGWLASSGPSLKRVAIWPDGVYVRCNRYVVHRDDCFPSLTPEFLQIPVARLLGVS